MSRELNRKQKNMLLLEVRENIKLEIPNPYSITTDSYFKIMELNEFETYHQNVNSYLDDLRNDDYKKTYG